MSPKISDHRKTAFYIGTGLQILGGLLFASTFVTAIWNFGDFTNFQADARSAMIRAFGGMALLIVGGVVRVVGARGMAGSGMVLDPEQARNDLEPYSRMGGGMLGDALDEAGISWEQPKQQPEQVVMIRCRGCGELSNETANYCQACGQKL